MTARDKTTRLCILQAGEHNEAMRGLVPSYRELFTAMFAPYDAIALAFFEVYKNVFPDSPDDWDAFLVTGSATGVYDDDPWLPQLRALIKKIAETRKPLVGICFGHQIIADTLGGKAALSEKGWGVGVRETALRGVNGDSGRDSFKLLYVHRDQVIAPPDGAEVIAGDAFCPIAAYRVADRILSYQGHPEFTPEVVDAIMDLRADDMGAEVIAEARQNLHAGDDSKTIARSIAEFIMRGGSPA